MRWLQHRSKSRCTVTENRGAKVDQILGESLTFGFEVSWTAY